MTGSLVIAPRFCGPPDSGNGGYVCGLIAGYLDGPAEVTLRRPPPLETPLAVERDDHGSARVLDGQTLIAEATRSPGGPVPQLPDPVSVQQASSGGARSQLRIHPELHPFPTCFVSDKTAGQVTDCTSWSDRWQAGSCQLMSGFPARSSRAQMATSGLSSCGRRSTAPEASEQSGTSSRVARHSCSVACRFARLARSAQASHMSCSAGA